MEKLQLLKSVTERRRITIDGREMSQLVFIGEWHLCAEYPLAMQNYKVEVPLFAKFFPASEPDGVPSGEPEKL